MSGDKVVMEVKSAKEIEQPYSPPRQSADTLFHFVSKFKYLISMIEKFAVIPRYCIEDVDYLEIAIKQIAYPMLCFCDINLHKIQEHMDLYGMYGIAFSKQWGIKKGVQPIQYINPQSLLRSDFSAAFLESLNSDVENKAQDFLQSQMYYFKAIQGTMDRNGKKIAKNFTDECEWRFIPDVKKVNLPQAVLDAEIFSVSTLNKALETTKECWLQFEAPDVKYIILNTEEEFRQVVGVIKSKKLDAKIIDRFLSKIVVWSDVRRDF